jgi:curli biogenesis system outer membrane secretion channel CsgG
MLTLVLSLALSAAAPEAAEAAAPTTTTTAAKPAKPKKICRSDADTGSRLKTRTCKTQEQWDNQQQDVGNDVRVGTGAIGR